MSGVDRDPAKALGCVLGDEALYVLRVCIRWVLQPISCQLEGYPPV